MKLKQEIYNTLILTQRDVMKLLRDKPRMIISLFFPLLFIVVFGLTLDSINSGASGNNSGFFIYLSVSGLLAQSVFQSSLSGMVSLVVDREKDFAMSIFVSPISRTSIVVGKILGESLVAFFQFFGILISGFILGARFPIENIIALIPFMFLVAFSGGALGLLISSRLEGEESAQRIFPIFVLPVSFLSGAFIPLSTIEGPLALVRDLNPLFYGVDMVRNILLRGSEFFENEALKNQAVSNPLSKDIILFAILTFAFVLIGTYLFRNKEGNR